MINGCFRRESCVGLRPLTETRYRPGVSTTSWIRRGASQRSDDAHLVSRQVLFHGEVTDFQLRPPKRRYKVNAARRLVELVGGCSQKRSDGRQVTNWTDCSTRDLVVSRRTSGGAYESHVDVPPVVSVLFVKIESELGYRLARTSASLSRPERAVSGTTRSGLIVRLPSGRRRATMLCHQQ